MRILGRLAGKLTYANVVATLALFIALGGASYAAVTLPKNSVGAKQIKKGSISTDKLSKSAVKSLKGAAGPPGANGLNGQNGAQGPPGTAGYAEVFSDEGSADISSGGSATIAKTEDMPTTGTFLVNGDVKLVAGATPINFNCKLGAYSTAGGTSSPGQDISVAAHATGEMHFARSMAPPSGYYFFVSCSSTSGAATVQGRVSAVPYDSYTRIKN